MKSILSGIPNIIISDLMFFIGWMPFMLIIMGFLAISFVFWIWMLVDCLQRKRFKDKLVWVLVMLFVYVFGAVLYYILVKSKETSRKRR